MEKLVTLIIVVIVLFVIFLVGLGFALAKFGFIALVYGLAVFGGFVLIGKIFN